MPHTLGTLGQQQNPAAAIDALNPIGWWRLNDTSGSTAVAKVGNDGTYVGSPTLEAGPLAIDGQSVEFDDSPSAKYAEVPIQSADINAAATAFTISAFVEFSDVSVANQFLWEEGASANGLCLCLEGDEVFGLAWASSTFISRISETGITTGTLYHIAYGYDSTGPTTVLYINGESVGTVVTNSGTSLPAHSSPNGIGGVNTFSRNVSLGRIDVSGYSCHGRIGDVARFSGLLTQDEVRSIARQNMAT